MERITYFKTLNNVWHELKMEKGILSDGNESVWPSDVLLNIIQPEIHQLMTHAAKGEIYLRYGEKIRRMESTVVVESNPTLANTALGESILALQKVIDQV